MSAVENSPVENVNNIKLLCEVLVLVPILLIQLLILRASFKSLVKHDFTREDVKQSLKQVLGLFINLALPYMIMRIIYDECVESCTPANCSRCTWI